MMPQAKRTATQCREQHENRIRELEVRLDASYVALLRLVASVRSLQNSQHQAAD